MMTVSMAQVAWFGLAWFVVGVFAGSLVPALAMRVLAGRKDRAAAGGSADSGQPASRVAKGQGIELYVGNLVYSVSRKEIEKRFGEFGAVVDVRLIHNKANGRSRGYGFVEMADKRGAVAAVKALNGADFKGRPIVVNEAKAKSENE